MPLLMNISQSLSQKGKSHTPRLTESIEKCKTTFKQNNHQQGSKNSQYGTLWITNNIEIKKIHKGDLIPDGWRLGKKRIGI